jgi:hypothetical protein
MSTRRANSIGPIALCALATAACVLAVACAVLPAVAAADECPNAAFRTGPASHLPDCRAYELVSPAEKNEGAPYLASYSHEGESAVLIITAATAGLEGLPDAGFKGPEPYYSTQRTASGWTTVPDDPPSNEYTPLGAFRLPYDFAGETLDGLSTFWAERSIWQPENSLGIYERRSNRSIVEVGPALPPTAPAGSVREVSGESQLDVQGISADGARVLFSLQGDYWPFDDTEGGARSLYEYAGTGNTTPLLVGVNQTGVLISKCGTELGSESGALGDNTHNAMSMDGQTVFFTARCGVRTGHELYARIDNGEPDARTVDISEPAKEDCAACDTEAAALTEDAHFEGASQDGSKVFFSTTQALLGGDTSRNLYEYDFDAPAGERIVRVSGGAAHAEVLETVHPLVSEDGSHVYFLASSVLTTAPNGQGEAAEAGADNLYVFERDASYPTGRIAFIARLSGEDLEQWKGNAAGGDVTPDGRFLVFTSERDLAPDTTSSGVRQVFEYDAQTGTLVRISIGQDGFNDNGNVPPILLSAGSQRTYENTDNAEIVVPGTGLVGAWGTFYTNRYTASAYTHTSVSADGSYVFFQSIVGLTPQALDRKELGTYSNDGNPPVPQFANNVYEYHDGRVSLISDGQDLSYKPIPSAGEPSRVQLLGTDESGRDVLFTTTDRLVGQDTDTTADIYDARIDGGFPPPASPAQCSGEACQGPLSAAPTLLSPGSEFQAGGNPPLAAGATSKSVAKPKAKKKANTKASRCKGRKCAKRKGRKASKADSKRRAKS